MTDKVLQKINNGREYRNMVLEIREDEEAEKVVEGYATTFNEPYELYSYEDRDGKKVTVFEQVDREAFKESDMSDVIMQYDHEGRVFARLSNGTLQLNADEHGLKVTANLGGTEIGRNLYEEIRGGYTNKMSFGFTVADDNIEPNGTDYIRTILKIGKLYDVSAVSYPQNNYTEISARSHCDGVIQEIETERMKAEEEKRIAQERKEILLTRINALKGANTHE